MSKYKPKVGDKVRVVIEGEIRKVWNSLSFEVGTGPYSNCVAPGEQHVVSVEKVKPPRIPEPGLWGVVRDERGDDWVRSGPTPISGIEWVNSRTGLRLDFDDIPGSPVLIRPGV